MKQNSDCNIKIALLQIAPCKTLEENLEKGISYCRKARESGADIALFPEMWSNGYNISKVHTCDFDVEHNLTPGEDFYVASLDTVCGEVKVGAMICYDREFPESARILMLKGAELILVPNACPMEINRLSQLRARAYENMTAIATCNYPETVPDCNGGSSVFDGTRRCEFEHIETDPPFL